MDITLIPLYDIFKYVEMTLLCLDSLKIDPIRAVNYLRNETT